MVTLAFDMPLTCEDCGAHKIKFELTVPEFLPPDGPATVSVDVVCESCGVNAVIGALPAIARRT